MFKPNELIELVKDLPQVREIIEKRMREESQKAARERFAVLDQIEQVAPDVAKIEKEIEAQKKKTEAAHDAYTSERGKLGALTVKLNQRNAEASRLHASLCDHHGEGIVERAACLLDSCVQSMRMRIAEVERSIKEMKPSDSKGRMVSQLNTDKEKVVPVERAYNQVLRLRLARMEPQEIAEKLTAILETVNLTIDLQEIHKKP